MTSFVALILVIALLGLMVKGVDFVSTTDQRIADDPLVHIVDQSLLQSKIKFGESEKCGITPCWLTTDYKDENWKSVELPKYNFRQDSEVKRAKSDKIYYRLKLTIPKNLLESNEEIVFSPLYVAISKLKIYVNGVLTQSLDQRSNQAGFVYINIPREYINGDQVIIGIEGKLSEGDNGIFHYLKMLIGPNTNLASLSRHAERANVSNHFLWTLTIGTLFVLFALLYVFTRNKESYQYVLIFSFGMLLIQLMKSELLGEMMGIPLRLWLIVLARTAASLAILNYFNYAFDLKFSKLYRYTAGVVLIIFGSLLSLGFKVELTYITIPFIFKYLDFTYFAAIVLPMLYMAFKKEVHLGHKLFLFGFFILQVALNIRGDLFYLNLLDLFLCLYIAFQTVLSFAEHEKKIIDQSLQLQKQARDVAIGKTAAMMAHDVRKPFTQVKILLDQFDLFKNNPSALAKAQTLIKKSLAGVDTMVSQVMDFSRDAVIESEPVGLSRILEKSLDQILMAYAGEPVEVDFHYKLDHKRKPLIPEWEVIRAVSNIIGNGIEAIYMIGGKSSGNLTIRSQNQFEGQKAFVKVDIINDGPLIPESALNNLFEPFFTSGKSNGTGLGLASVKKTMEKIGGKVEVNNIENGVCFSLTLPSSDFEDPGTLDFLPKQLSSQRTVTSIEDYKHINTYKGSFNILILEDQKIYVTHLKTIIKDLPFESAVEWVTSSYDALEKVKTGTFDLIISDLDLEGNDQALNFLRSLNQETATLIIHSNRPLIDQEKSLLTHLSFSEVPKPMEASDFFTVVDANLEIRNTSQTTKSDKKLIYYCDDSEIMRSYFEMIVANWNHANPTRPLELEVFEKGEDLLKAYQNKPSDMVFSDYYMDDTGGKLNGLDVLRETDSTNFYLISNFASPEIKDKLLKSGGKMLLQAPLEESELIEIFNQI